MRRPALSSTSRAPTSSKSSAAPSAAASAPVRPSSSRAAERMISLASARLISPGPGSTSRTSIHTLASSFTGADTDGVCTGPEAAFSRASASASAHPSLRA